MSDFNELNVGPKWYVAHTYTGYENKVKAAIERAVENRNLSHLIFDVKIPVTTSVQIDSKGREKIVEEKIFPAYVFVKMIMNDESWHIVRNITGVTGFVGPGSEPTPLTDEEVEFAQVEKIKEEFKFKVGDRVKVVSGVLEGYVGVLQEISEDKKSLVILANTGKRDIPLMVETKDVDLAD